MNGLDFCQNPKKLHFGVILGDFLGPPDLTWPDQTRRFFSKIGLHHLFHFVTSRKKSQKIHEPNSYHTFTSADFKKSTWIHLFILEIKLILKFLDLSDHPHVWPLLPKKYWNNFNLVQAACKKTSSLY